MADQERLERDKPYAYEVVPRQPRSAPVEGDQAGTTHFAREEQVVQSAGIEHHERVIQTDRHERRERVTHDLAAERRAMLAKVAQFVWLVTGLLLGLIALRVLLRVIGANPNNDFAQFVYGLRGLFVGPFADLVANPRSNGMVLEVTSLIAMLVYALIAWALVKVLWLALYRPSTRSIAVYDRERV
jgi:hypothetical protein